MLATVNDTITVKRWTEVSGESSYTNLTTGLSCYIEPAEYEVAVNTDGENFSEVYNLFCDNINILVWDRVVDKNSNEYTVKGTKIFNDIIGQHIEAIILKVFD